MCCFAESFALMVVNVYIWKEKLENQIFTLGDCFYFVFLKMEYTKVGKCLKSKNM